MTRRALEPNRKDYSYRQPQHDLEAVPKVSDLFSPGGDPCDPCGDCLSGGPVGDCSHCRSAPLQYSFAFPNLSGLITGGDQSLTSYTVDWATDCTWEGDDIPVACSGTDQFGFSLEIAGRNPGDVALTATRRAGSNCEDVTFVYRNFYPLRCNCPMLMFLDRESVSGIDADDLPCSVCIRVPRMNCTAGSCEGNCPRNWEITVGSVVIRTDSGPLSLEVGLGSTSLFDCYWWTTQPTGGLYTLVTVSETVDHSGPFDSHNIVVAHYSDPPEMTLSGGNWVSPFIGDPVSAQWNSSTGINGEGCSCQDDLTLPLTAGAGASTIHLAYFDD